MERRRYCDPILIGPDRAVLPPLERVSFDQRAIDEAWLQELLRAQPGLLPLAEIEPAFAPAVCIGREVGTKVGAIDNLYISPGGYLTLVETKLWRNPEARREVVGQILDYVKELATWTYDRLDKVARDYSRRYHERELSLLNLVQSVPDAQIDEATFLESVSLNLRRARVLLVIVGDGIRESVEGLVAFLQQAPGLPFTLALVELLVYKAPAPPGALLFIPQLVLRSREVPRAVVWVEPSHMDFVRVGAPEVTEGDSGPPTLTEEDFLHLLSQKAGQGAVTFARDLLKEGERLGLAVEWKQSSFVLKLPDPQGSGHRLTLLVVTRDGTAYVGWLPVQLQEIGLPAQLGRDYFARTAELFPNCAVSPKGFWTRIVTLDELQARYEAFWQILRDTRAAIERAVREGPAQPGNA